MAKLEHDDVNRALGIKARMQARISEEGPESKLLPMVAELDRLIQGKKPEAEGTPLEVLAQIEKSDPAKGRR